MSIMDNFFQIIYEYEIINRMVKNIRLIQNLVWIIRIMRLS